MEQIKLDIVPAGIAPVAHASQFDNGRQIRFNLFNQGTPYTLTGAETVTMVVNGEEENITNTSDNYVIWDVAEEDCAEVGVIGCEIRIVLGSMLIGSKNFFLEVEMDPYDGKNVRIVTVGPADICTFETTIPEPLQSVTVDVEATGGNGTPDNPNPINGYTEVNITRCCVNLWDEEWEVGALNYTNGNNQVNLNNVRSKNYIPVTPSTTVYIKVPTGQPIIVCEYDASNTFIASPIYGYGNVTLTTNASTHFIRFCTIGTPNYGNTYNNDISINYPANDTQYHPYTGNTYTIAFGQTVYGGVLDVTRGKLRVTHKQIDLGELYYQYYGGRFNTNAIISDIGGSIVGDHYINVISDIYLNSMSQTNNTFFVYNNKYLYIYDNRYTDGNDLKNALSGHSLVYELATPFDIDLTPEVISAVVGENNVFADCGETEVKYLKAGE